jgi:hypothetical protein
MFDAGGPWIFVSTADASEVVAECVRDDEHSSRHDPPPDERARSPLTGERDHR